MNIIELARAHTGLTQTKFGEALGNLARDKPITQNRISEYESGRVAPSQKVREAATPWAARELMRQLADAPKSAMEDLLTEAIR